MTRSPTAGLVSTNPPIMPPCSCATADSPASGYQLTPIPRSSRCVGTLHTQHRPLRACPEKPFGL